MLTRLFIGKDINQAKNTFVWTALSGIVYSLQSLIFLIILTNLMGKSAAGLYSLGIMIANQMLTVGKYSVRNYQVSDINEKYTFDQYYTFRICTCAVAMLITIGWVIFGGYRGDEAVVIISLTVYKMAECMSDRLIGLTIVALGTSLPELITSVTAACKHNADIAIGNIVGSNIFNIPFVFGITALLTPDQY